MIILIHGRKRSGKDTLASILKELEPSFISKSFAGPLKEITAKSFELSLDTVEYLKNNEDIKIGFRSPQEKLCTGKSMRNFLQNLGTEAIKPIFGDDVWAQLLIKDYDKSSEDLVVPDFRVIEEYNTLVQELGADDIVTIKVTRPEVEESGDLHATEQGLVDFKFDYYIDNDGTLDDLRAEAISFIDFLKAKV